MQLLPLSQISSRIPDKLIRNITDKMIRDAQFKFHPCISRTKPTPTAHKIYYLPHSPKIWTNLLKSAR